MAAARLFPRCGGRGLLQGSCAGFSYGGFTRLRAAYVLFTCSCGARALRLARFSSCSMKVSCGSGALGHKLNSCGSWALLLCSVWDLPGPGNEPVSPALAGGFFTTEPPGKPWKCVFRSYLQIHFGNFSSSPALVHSKPENLFY